MQLQFFNYMPKEFEEQAALLFYNSLIEKFAPILNSQEKALEVLKSSFISDMCIVAIHENKLVGLVGMQTTKQGFIEPDFKAMQKVYGFWGAWIRLAKLALLHHKAKGDELYIDGIVVADEMRGRGVGSKLFEQVVEHAKKENLEYITLEVIDTNPKAKALYERLGFKVQSSRSLFPYNKLLGFSFERAEFMRKKIS